MNQDTGGHHEEHHEAHEEHTEEAHEEESKEEEKTEEKTEEKSEEKSEDKSEDKPEEKSEEKSEKKPEAKSDEGSEEKSEEKKEEKKDETTESPDKSDKVYPPLGLISCIPRLTSYSLTPRRSPSLPTRHLESRRACPTPTRTTPAKSRNTRRRARRERVSLRLPSSRALSLLTDLAYVYSKGHVEVVANLYQAENKEERGKTSVDKNE